MHRYLLLAVAALLLGALAQTTLSQDETLPTRHAYVDVQTVFRDYRKRQQRGST